MNCRDNTKVKSYDEDPNKLQITNGNNYLNRSRLFLDGYTITIIKLTMIEGKLEIVKIKNKKSKRISPYLDSYSHCYKKWICFLIDMNI